MHAGRQSERMADEARMMEISLTSQCGGAPIKNVAKIVFLELILTTDQSLALLITIHVWVSKTLRAVIIQM